MTEAPVMRSLDLGLNRCMAEKSGIYEESNMSDEC